MSDEQPIRVLHFSSRYEECGVAKYLGHYVKGMESIPSIQNDYFDVSPYQTPHMSDDDLDAMASRLKRAKETTMYCTYSMNLRFMRGRLFNVIIEAGKRSGKKVVITVHISPSMHGALRSRAHWAWAAQLCTLLRQIRTTATL